MSMYSLVLTLLLCLSKPDVIFNLEEDNNIINYEGESPYNIHEWIQGLQLQTCALVAIGLKYFAIFVEDIGESEKGTLKSTKFFVGICHQATLEQWDFCSKKLAKKRKHKCRFKPKDDFYEGRVHRKFCDLNVMVKNKDCICSSFILEQEVFKVIGFPTCYFLPLPHSLCKYNVCGLSKCRPFTAQNSLHSVECDPNCKSGNPFCEGPSFRSSSPPKIHSRWSKWSHLITDVADISESPPNRSLNTTPESKKHRLLATCINKYKNKPDLDCLGPGTGCCPSGTTNCTCRTYEEGQALRLEKIFFEDTTREAHINFHEEKRRKKSHRKLRDTEDDIEDDDDDNEDLNEDIVLEEDTTTDTPTTETLEKEELDENMKNDMEEEIKIVSKNNTSTQLNRGYSHRIFTKFNILLLFIINISINIYNLCLLSKFLIKTHLNCLQMIIN